MSQLPQQVLRALGAADNADVAPLPGNENENWLVAAGGESFVVKRLRGHSADNAEAEAAYRQCLADNGLPVALYIPLAGNSYVTTIGSDDFVATPYVEGKMSKPSKQVVAEAAVLLAKTHLLEARGLPQRQNWYRREYVPDALNLISDAYAEAKQACMTQRAEYPDFWSGELPQGIIHGDLQEENIIVNDQGKVVSLIDWEEAGVEPLLLDVAHSAQQLSFERGVCNQELFDAFMTTYQAVRPLTDLEIRWFDEALRYTMLVLSVWAYVKKSRNEMDDDLFERLSNYYRASYEIPRVRV